MIRTYTYKLYNNQTYEKKYEKWIDVSRCIYNLAKEVKEEAYKKGVKLSKYDLSAQLTELRKEYDWIREINSQSSQAILERLENSYKNFYRNLKNGTISELKTKYIEKCNKNSLKINWKKYYNIGRPKWAKKDRFHTIIFKQGNLNNTKPNIYQTEKGFKLPKFGEVKVFNNKRKIDGKIKQAKLTKKADGFYLHIIVEQEDVKESQLNKIVALDMGIKYFCVTSDGEFIDNPRFLQKKLKDLRVEQRTLSRRFKQESKIQSKGFYKQKKVVGKFYKKVVDARKDFLHKISSDIARYNSTVVVENLNIQGLLRNNKLSKYISDCSWGTFFQFLEYKTEVIKVNPAYSSQECSQCGHTCKENRPTQSLFSCVECNHTANADFDACQVLLNRYYQEGYLPWNITQTITPNVFQNLKFESISTLYSSQFKCKML